MWWLLIVIVLLIALLVYIQGPDLKITHSSGFFSCCSVKLDKIIEYVNANKRLPNKIDSSEQFKWYKKGDEDVTYEFFTPYGEINENIEIDDDVDYKENYQYIKFSELNYNKICPYVTKYFTPSLDVKKYIDTIENKYEIDYDNTCALFSRGNDKATEMALPPYDYYLNTANSILKENPSMKFLIQSDETEFIEFISENFPNNSFYFKDEIRHMRKTNSTVDLNLKNDILEFSKKYLAITNIMSRCKYVVCASGNCSIWITLYRKNSVGVFQFT